MLNKDELKKRINEEEDFIHCPRFGNSLTNLIESNPDGIDDERIAKVLMISEEDVADIYENAIKKLQDLLGVKDGD